MRADVVHVFCDARGAHGNALGVLVAAASTAGREQALATRLGFSETVVVDALPSPPEHRARVRIFTPAVELPFAGHPSVGTAWWLARQGTPAQVLDVPAGPVDVRAEGDLTWVRARPEWAPDFVFTELGSPDEVDALEAAAFTAGSHYVWAWTDRPAGAIRSRMFAPALGVAEDEATGAAAIRLTTALGRALTIRQGEGSVLHTRPVADGWVELGGRVRPASAVELD